MHLIFVVFVVGILTNSYNDTSRNFKDSLINQFKNPVISQADPSKYNQ